MMVIEKIPNDHNRRKKERKEERMVKKGLKIMRRVLPWNTYSYTSITNKSDKADRKKGGKHRL